jgi:hypothetical protein
MAESSKLSSRFAQVLYDVFFKSSILWSRLRIKKSYRFLPFFKYRIESLCYKVISCIEWTWCTVMSQGGHYKVGITEIRGLDKA